MQITASSDRVGHVRAVPSEGWDHLFIGMEGPRNLVELTAAERWSNFLRVHGIQA